MATNLSGSTTAVFIVTLSAALEKAVNVGWATADGTAKAGVDYEAGSGTVTFEPGETVKQVQVVVYGREEGAPADSRTFKILLTPPENAILDQQLTEVTITVTDDAGAPVTTLTVATGPRGLKGDPGLNSYELAKLQGFEGTLADYIEQETAAGNSADRAEAAYNNIDIAIQQASDTVVASATVQAERAEAASNAAVIARDGAQIAALSVGLYDDVAAGLAATTSGQYFTVPQGVDALESYITYKNNSGSAAPAAITVGRASVAHLESFRINLTLNSAGQWVDEGSDTSSTNILADSAGRKVVYADHGANRIVAYGRALADQKSVSELGAETWIYEDDNPNIIVEQVDLAGRLVRYLNVAEGVYYVLGRPVGSEATITPLSFLPEFIDDRNYGQSLSVYLLGSPGILTPTQNTFMFNTQVLTYGTNPTSLVPLPQPTANQYQQSLIHDHQQKLDGIDNCKFLLACSGVSGAPMSDIEPGTAAYTHLVGTMQKAKDLGDAAGMQYGMIAFKMHHGEADAYKGSGYAYYRPKLKNMQSVTNQHAKDISKLSHDVPMILYQMASHGRYEGLVYPSHEIPLAQLDEAISNPLIHLATPMYIFEYKDGVHLTADGYRHRDLFFAKAERYWIENGKPWKPMHMVNVSRVGNSTLVGDIFVPKGKFQFSTSTVSAATDGMQGLELWSESQTGVLTRLPIPEVSTLSDTKIKVRSGVNFGANEKIYLAYALTPENRGASDGAGRYPDWNAGPTGGVRGNICDTDDETSDLRNRFGNPYDLRNYMTIFRKEAI